jgi:predicted metalloprotease with PDZ domain
MILHADVVSDSGGGDKAAASAIFRGENRPETDAAGRFTIDHVANGRGHVALWPHSITHPLASKEYTAAAGQRIDVDTMMVVPPLDGASGTLGIEATLSGNTLEVTTVIARSPAAQAGIVAGDEITAIQGHTIAELTPTVAEQLVASGAIGAGQTVAFTLARGTTVNVTAAKW